MNQFHYDTGDSPLSSEPVSNSDYALRYAQLGFEVFPIAPGTKTPYTGSRGYHDATCSLELVRRAWTKRPDASIGIVPSRSALIVLDFDNRNGGQFALNFLRERLGKEAFDTCVAKTHDGIHVYYSDTGSAPAAKLLSLSKMGVDVFGPYDGMKPGYVVAPPSRHPDGGNYEWQGGYSPIVGTLQPFPTDMVPALNEYVAQHKGANTSNASKNNILDFDDRIHRTNLSLDDEEDDDDSLRQHDKNPRFVQAVCDYMRIPFEPGKPFCSPLRPDTHPSACIHQAPDGSYRYHDFTDDKKYFSLAQLYGAFVTGKQHPLPQLSSVQFAVWQTRLLLDIGWVKDPPPVIIPSLPKNAPQAAVDMYEGFRQLLICRAVFYGRVAPTPYTHSFAAQWTGKSLSDATTGVAWLKRHGFLKQCGSIQPKTGRPMSLYVPSGYVAPEECDNAAS